MISVVDNQALDYRIACAHLNWPQFSVPTGERRFYQPASKAASKSASIFSLDGLTCCSLVAREGSCHHRLLTSGGFFISLHAL